MSVSSLPPLSLYIHIPWCVRKCPYCDFNSHQVEVIPEQEYVRALLSDLKYEGSLSLGRKLHSIFIGGGTPSLFKPGSIAKVLELAERLFGFCDDIEITMEANPGATEYSQLEGYKAAGVNRLSFGVQSFNDQHLQRLGRIHSSKEAIQAFENARKASFTNINIDLMHGLPEQNLEQAMEDVRRGIQLEPEHLSWYQLTVEPNTVFFNHPPKLPAEDALFDIQEQGHELLGQSQFCQYEVSAYSKSEFQSKHNLNYWQFGDYLAVGAGAHGKITRLDGTMERYRKTRKPNDYLARSLESDSADFTAARSDIPKDSQMLEFMMNALRLVDGVPAHYFTERTELHADALLKPVAELVHKGLLEKNSKRLQTTRMGMQFLNNTLSFFE